MKKKASQTQKILKHLETKGHITPMQAINKYDCMRLAARISDLKKEGFDIETKLINKNAKQFAQYWLC